jgi:general secretion pathway protein A
MYETHFGLKKRPFRAHARGNDVFIGPQSAATIAGIKKALAAPDGIVAVTGPIGSGKTTLAYRALEGIGTRRTVITVGRITLDHDEVLELLLEGLGARELPPGTVQKFTLFRRKLEKLAKDGTRVLVVVEDAARIGVAALSELEALTAADTGASEGAGVVLMGEPDVANLLGAPELGRLRQRLRLRQAVEPLKSAEMLAYFKHCFRQAGGEFDALFAAGSGELVHSLSGGIPRMANNLIESALTTGAERKAEQVTLKLIQRVARDEYGLSAEPAQPDPATAGATVPDATPAPEAASTVPETTAAETAPAEPETATTQAAPEADATREEDEFVVPELIQDTLPELEILAPKSSPASSVHGKGHKRGKTSARPASAEVAKTPEPPTLEPQIGPRATQAKSASVSEPPAGLAADEIPAWDRDPTLAELRPDLEALEHAMALAHGGEAEEPDPEPEPAVSAPAAPQPAEIQAPAVPEITLDKQIQAKIDEAAEAIKKTEARAAAKAAADAEAEGSLDLATSEHPALELPPKSVARPVENNDAPAAQAEAPEIPQLEVSRPKPAEPKSSEPKPAAPAEAGRDGRPDTPASNEEPDREFRQIAANLARAKTIDDVDDKMAETLFGEQFSAIAAQVAAKAAAHLSANDDAGAVDDAPVDAAPAPKRKDTAGVPGNGKAPALPEAPGIDESASRRLATVRALNAGPAAPKAPGAVTPPTKAAESSPRSQAQAPVEPPKSIEEQINTSMTQTLKALNVRPPVDDDDEDDQQEGKGGFFGRFRKS